MGAGEQRYLRDSGGGADRQRGNRTGVLRNPQRAALHHDGQLLQRTDGGRGSVHRGLGGRGEGQHRDALRGCERPEGDGALCGRRRGPDLSGRERGLRDPRRDAEADGEQFRVQLQPDESAGELPAGRVRPVGHDGEPERTDAGGLHEPAGRRLPVRDAAEGLHGPGEQRGFRADPEGKGVLRRGMVLYRGGGRGPMPDRPAGPDVHSQEDARAGEKESRDDDLRERDHAQLRESGRYEGQIHQRPLPAGGAVYGEAGERTGVRRGHGREILPDRAAARCG